MISRLYNILINRISHKKIEYRLKEIEYSLKIIEYSRKA